MKRFPQSFLIGVMLVVASTKAFAVNPGNRVDLFYDNGYFHHQNGWWYETINGNYQYEFRETFRNDQYIDIYDSSRRMAVRLYNDSFWTKPNGASAFTRYKNAHWETRRMVSFGNPVNNYLLLGTNNSWKHTVIYPDHANDVYYKETSRVGGLVELRNEAMKVTLRIIGTAPGKVSVFRQIDGQGMVEMLAGGSWGITE